MTNKYKESDKRLEKAYRRLGTHNPTCVGCGFCGSPHALELAHVAPKAFHDDVGILCSNCHRTQSDSEKDYPYQPQSDNPQMEAIGHYLLGVSEFLQMIAETMSTFAHWLLEQSEHVLPYTPEEVA